MSKITKRIRVTFDMTAVFDVESVTEALVDMAKDFHKDPIRHDHEARLILADSLEFGPEAAIERMLKIGLRNLVKEKIKGESSEEMTLRPSPARVDIIR